MRKENCVMGWYGAGYGYGNGYGYGCGYGYGYDYGKGYGGFISTGTILVLFILLVIILRTFL
ncbi:hypothetical protein B5S25_02525 [Paenibacillus larvae subsp. pulvifaciens]|nr:hypothetical protein B5S25_02525 [Paenibacillus larvae subsp. pulvifaciens]